MKLRKQNGFVTPPELADSSKIDTLFVDGQSAEKDALESTDALLHTDILGISANILSKGHSKRVFGLLSSVHVLKTNTDEILSVPVIDILGDNPISIKYGRAYVEYGATISGIYNGESISIDISNTVLPEVDTLNGTAVKYSVEGTDAYRGITWLAAVPVMTMVIGTDTLAAGGTFIDAGIDMLPDNDDLTVNVISDVNDAIAGSYTVTYNATSILDVIVETLVRNVTIT